MRSGGSSPEGSMEPARLLGSQVTYQGMIRGQLHGILLEAGRPLAKLGVVRARREKIMIVVITIY